MLIDTRQIIAIYEKAMTSFVRLLQFKAINYNKYKSEITSFTGPLAVSDVIDLSIAIRHLVELCDLEKEAKAIVVNCLDGHTINLYKLVSRMIHSTWIDVVNTKYDLVCFAVDDPIDMLARMAGMTFDELIIDPPLVIFKSKSDGAARMDLHRFLAAVDEMISQIVQALADRKIHVERFVREN